MAAHGTSHEPGDADGDDATVRAPAGGRADDDGDAPGAEGEPVAAAGSQAHRTSDDTHHAPHRKDREFVTEVVVCPEVPGAEKLSRSLAR